jgi:outer membrane protein assembly factor BamD (BamD/ComL family)
MQAGTGRGEAIRLAPRLRLLEFASVLALLCAVCGCAMFNPKADADSAYEETRRRVEGGRVSQASYEEAEEDAPPAPLELEDFSPDHLGRTFKRLMGQGPDRKLARQLYAEAEDLYWQASRARNGQGQDAAAEGDEDWKAKFLEAAELYAEAADRFPDSALEEDALFMAGESYFFADHLPDANEMYELLLKQHPNSRHLDRVEARRFSIARFWVDLERYEPQSSLSFNFTDDARPFNRARGSAIKVFDKIRLDDPTGDLADDATLAAATAWFEAGDYFKADQFYTDMRTMFPTSEHQFTAHLMGVKSKLLCYQGPAYGGAVLDEAEQLIMHMRRAFPKECQEGENDKYLNRAYAEVRFRKAEQEWTRASYYDRRAEYGAARIHYQTVIRDYDGTGFDEKARERLSEIAGRPDVPPQRFGWLVDLFADGSKMPIAKKPGTVDQAPQ